MCILDIPLCSRVKMRLKQKIPADKTLSFNPNHMKGKLSLGKLKHRVRWMLSSY